MASKNRVSKVIGAKERHEQRLRQPFELALPEQKAIDSFTTRRGKWVETDRNVDTRLKLRKEYVQQGVNNNGQEPLGKLIADEKLFQDLKDKKDQGEYTFFTQMANLLVDPKNPESQSRVYASFPDLKQIPKEQYTEDVAHQEMLREMLRNGVVPDQDAHSMILVMMNYDYDLPLSPLWDPDGKILNQPTVAPFVQALTLEQARAADVFARQNVLNGSYQYGIRIPNSNEATTYLDALVNVKVAILKRLYPGIRAMYEKCQTDANYMRTLTNPVTGNPPGNPDEAMVNWYNKHFKNRQDPVTGGDMNNSVVDWSLNRLIP